MATKIKVKPTDNGHDVLVLAKHPMETGNRKDKATGEVIPAHFITNMDFALNGTNVATVNLSQAVSTNPLVGISISGGKSGDTVTVSWVDNKDGTETAEAAIK